jgi:hypothetical protein
MPRMITVKLAAESMGSTNKVELAGGGIALAAPDTANALRIFSSGPDPSKAHGLDLG